MTYRTLQNIITTFERSDIPLEKITFWLNRNAVHDNKHGNNYKDFTLQDTIACTLITQHNDIVGLSTISRSLDIFINNNHLDVNIGPLLFDSPDIFIYMTAYL